MRIDYHEAAQALWDFVWHEFCDWYLEVKKLRFREDSGQDEHWTQALAVYESLLRLLHPFMPFITEELWQRSGGEHRAGEHGVSISLAAYPQAHGIAADAARAFAISPAAANRYRRPRTARRQQARSEMTLPATVVPAGFQRFLKRDLAAISALAKLDITTLRERYRNKKASCGPTPDFDLADPCCHLQNGALDPRSRARIVKEIATLRSAPSRIRGGNLTTLLFVSRAPEKVIASLRAKLAEYEASTRQKPETARRAGLEMFDVSHPEGARGSRARPRRRHRTGRHHIAVDCSGKACELAADFIAETSSGFGRYRTVAARSMTAGAARTSSCLPQAVRTIDSGDVIADGGGRGSHACSNASASR